MAAAQKTPVAVDWTGPALLDLQDIWEYLAQHAFPDRASDIGDRIMKYADDLAFFPRQGKVGISGATYELILPDLPYVLVYALKGTHLVILRVIHTSRQRL